MLLEFWILWGKINLCFMKNTNASFPAETKIHMAFPTNIVIFFATAIAFALVGVSGLYFNEIQVLWPSLILSSVLIGIGFWELSKRKKYTGAPKIILNAQGIQVIGHKFAAWNDIKYARVASSATSASYLTFNHHGQDISVSLVGLNVQDDQLEQMLSYYRKLAK